MLEPSAKAGLFVYGSLMEGFHNYEKALTGQIESRVPAFVNGRLYHQRQKGYPALVSGDDRVFGELLTLRDFMANMEVLDQIEEYHGPGEENEYNRILTPVHIGESGVVEFAYVYWYGREDLDGASNPSVYIPSGNWRIYKELDHKI